MRDSAIFIHVQTKMKPGSLVLGLSHSLALSSQSDQPENTQPGFKCWLKRSWVVAKIYWKNNRSTVGWIDADADFTDFLDPRQ